ncbi:MAG: hypothetical protein JRN06_10145 [Nitrososphaerota archaeon]|nr:hypothetical protein [Nitrososphaerota archaeon]MDG7024948.1 hypothetical protein [Nitrososphaerota archaeon]
MALINSADEAESVASEWLKQRYPRRLAKASISHVMLEGGTWTVKANLEIRGDLFGRKKSTLMLRIDPESMNVVGYSDVTVTGKA